MKKQVLIFSLVTFAVLIGAVFVIRNYFSQDAIVNQQKKDLPSPVVSLEPMVNKSPEQKTSANESQTNTVPSELNLDIPFTSQAPLGNWDETHEEACEEASVLMANRYLSGRGIADAEDAEQALQEIIAWEKDNLSGVWKSTTAQETAKIITDFLGAKAELVYTPSIDQIKQALAANKLVLVPAAGRELGNPFYKSPGPLYHMLVIKGYTRDQFITNDPGTKRGANYPYKYDVLMSANRDWNAGEVAIGDRVMIFVSK